MMFRSPRATQTYCRDETDPILLTGVSDSVADYEIGEMAKWRMAAPGKTVCCLRTILRAHHNKNRFLYRLESHIILRTILRTQDFTHFDTCLRPNEKIFYARG